MKIIFFGTSEFAIPSLKKLVEAGNNSPHPVPSPFKGRGSEGEGFPSYEIAAVVTQPDKPAGRKQKPLPSPVKLWTLEHGLEVLQPEKLDKGFVSTAPLSLSKDGEGGRTPGAVELKDIDIAVVASYGKIIPKEILDIPKFGTLNIHPSLLPKYRGPSPIQAAILNGDEETGVTIIKLDEEMDHGPVVTSTKFEIRNSKPGFKELHDELAELGAELLIKTLPKYISGKIKPIPQDHTKATFTKIISKDNALIDWHRPAEEIERQVRAYETWPVAWTRLNAKRLKIYRGIVYDRVSTSPLPLSKDGEGGRRPGEVEKPGTIRIQNQKLLIQCGQDILELLELQLEGAKKMPASEFIRGQRDLQGKQFI